MGLYCGGVDGVPCELFVILSREDGEGSGAGPWTCLRDPSPSSRLRGCEEIEPRSGGIYVAQRVSAGKTNRAETSRGAAAYVAAPRLDCFASCPQGLRLGLRRCRRSAAVR